MLFYLFLYDKVNCLHLPLSALLSQGCQSENLITWVTRSYEVFYEIFVLTCMRTIIYEASNTRTAFTSQILVPIAV